MRKSTTNTFKDGLVMDLNPINTPNTVLTDCINGTIITYNGNEYSLQNDMGNFPLVGCSLDNNFIPLGLKEYGGILYIVSYNPITKQTQIGSYPSIKEAVNTTVPEVDSSISFDIISDNNENIHLSYKDIESKSKMCIISKDLTNKSIINPGDEYTFNPETPDNKSAFQSIEYYILDSNKNTYNITDELNIKNEQCYVSWQIPGWLVAKKHTAELSSFAIDIISINVDPFSNGESTVNATIKFTWTSYDKLINNYNDGKTIPPFIIKGNWTFGNQTGDINESNINSISLYNGAKSYYCSKDIKFNVTSNNLSDKLSIAVTPWIYNLEYDNMTASLVRDINRPDDITDIVLGDHTWQYDISDILSITFNTSGISSIKNKDLIHLYYTLYTMSSDGSGLQIVKDANGNNISDKEVENWNKDGWNTVIELDMVPYNGVNDGKLYKENIYKISFTMKCNNSVIGNPIEKLIIASEVMNGFSDPKYDEISFDTWFNKYFTYINNKNLIIDSFNVIDSSIVSSVNQSDGFTKWYTDNKDAKYKTFKTEKIKDVYLNGTISYDANIAFNSDVELLHGPLWESLLNNTSLIVNSGTNNISIPFSSNGKLSDSVNKIIKTNGKYIKRVNYDVTSELATIANYKLSDLACARSDIFIYYNNVGWKPKGTRGKNNDYTLSANIETNISLKDGDFSISRDNFSSQTIRKDSLRISANCLENSLSQALIKYPIIYGEINVWSDLYLKNVVYRLSPYSLDSTQGATTGADWFKVSYIAIKNGSVPQYILFESHKVNGTYPNSDNYSFTEPEGYVNKLKESIKKIEYESNKIVGEFDKIKESIEDIRNVNNISLSGKIKVSNSPEYCTKFLLDANGRKEINETFNVKNNNFNISQNPKIEEIELNKADDAFIPILNDAKLTELNGLLEAYDSQISEKNDAVKTEIDKLEKDLLSSSNNTDTRYIRQETATAEDDNLFNTILNSANNIYDTKVETLECNLFNWKEGENTTSIILELGYTNTDINKLNNN